MKKILAITTVLIFTMMFTSCGYKAKIEAATAKSDSLQLALNDQHDIINDAFTDIDDIASSLADIAEREKVLAATSKSELNQLAKVRIADNIAAISDLLQKNRVTMAHLTASSRQLKAANIKITALDSLLSSLQSQMQKKDADLTQMSAHLAKLKVEVTELTGLNETLASQNVTLETTVATQTVDLNKVYWILNSEKELRAAGIVDKRGFIGRTLVLKDIVNLDDFAQGDLRNIERISIDKKGVKIVSSHPEGSYELVIADKNRVQELVIRDKTAFWKTSKVLVISYTK